MTSSDHLPTNYTPPINTPLVHIPTGQLFRVLCNCRNMSPTYHTQRFVAAHPTLFRHATAEELTP